MRGENRNHGVYHKTLEPDECQSQTSAHWGRMLTVLQGGVVHTQVGASACKFSNANPRKVLEMS